MKRLLFVRMNITFFTNLCRNTCKDKPNQWRCKTDMEKGPEKVPFSLWVRQLVLFNMMNKTGWKILFGVSIQFFKTNSSNTYCRPYTDVLQKLLGYTPWWARTLLKVNDGKIFSERKYWVHKYRQILMRPFQQDANLNKPCKNSTWLLYKPQMYEFQLKKNTGNAF